MIIIKRIIPIWEGQKWGIALDLVTDMHADSNKIIHR